MGSVRLLGLDVRGELALELRPSEVGIGVEYILEGAEKRFLYVYDTWC